MSSRRFPRSRVDGWTSAYEHPPGSMTPIPPVEWAGRQTSSVPDRARLWTGSVVTAGGYAWLTTDLRPFTLPLMAAILMGGLVAVALGANLLPARAPRLGPPRRLAVWAALSAALALWELGSFLQHPRVEHPTLSSLANTLFQSHVARALGLLMWLGTGTRLARR